MTLSTVGGVLSVAGGILAGLGPGVPPLVTEGLVAQFSADSGLTVDGTGRVSAWADQSGLGNDAAQATETSRPYRTLDWAGRPMVQCENHTLAAATGVTLDRRAMSVFVAYRNNHIANQSLLVAGGIGALSDPGSGALYPGILFGGRESGARWTTSPAAFGMSSALTADGGVRAFYAGRATESLAQVGTYGTGVGCTIGGRGAYYEVLIYERPVSQAEGEQIAAYLAAKYDLRTASYSKQIVYEGDSLTQGAGIPSGNGFPMQAFRDDILDWRQSNMAVSGSTVASATTRAPKVDAYLDAVMDRNVLSVTLGRNDMGSGGTLTPEQHYEGMRTYCAARVAAGWEVWVGMLFASINRATDTTYNDLLKGTPGGGTGPGIIAEVPGVTRVVPYVLTGAENYQADGVHPNEAGAAVLAGIAAAEIAA